tara:strand:- start:108 stop:653 length:546 start_codon:yes stop_codon:yes gene_type:complete
MNDIELKEWMAKVNKRLDALEGVEETPTPAPVRKAKTTSYPRWIYRREPGSGEVQAQLIQTEAEMPPEGTFSDSPAKLDEAEEFEAVIAPSLDPEPEPEPEIEPEDSDLTIPHPGAPKEESIVPDMTQEMEFVLIPDDWRGMHHSSRIKLAKQLPGGDDVVSNDDAIALIELELENRGNAD